MVPTKLHKQIASSGSVLLSLIILAFAIALQPAIDGRRTILIYLCAYVGMIGSLAYLMLGAWELIRHERRLQTVISVVVSAVAAFISWRPLFLVIHGKIL